MAFNKIFSPTVGLNFWELLVSETAVKAGLLMKKAFARPVARGCKVEVKVLTRRMETANKGRDEEVPSQWCYAHRPQD